MRLNRLRSLRPVLAAPLALLLAAAPVLGAGPSVSIASVGGQAVSGGVVPGPLSGTVDVRGTAVTGTPAGAAVAQLVADAGDSPFVAQGTKATLIGAAWGGHEPYAFAWSTSAGTISEGASSATALLDTTGLAVGRYSATLRVTDSTGATATDTVRIVVARSTSQTLLDQTKADPVLANVGVGNPSLTNYLDFPFQVPAGIASMTIDASWLNPVNDYDLHLIDPTGAERGYSGNGATNLILQLESTGTASPAAGTWVVRMERYLTVTDSVRVVVTGRIQDPDPRPIVSAGGPYRFALGATQRLDGTVSGGGAPVATAWDLDQDGRFETLGTDVSPTLAAGHRLVTLKATDGGGLERRQTTSLLVADPARLAEDTTRDHRHRRGRLGRQPLPPRVQRDDLPGSRRPRA